MTIKIQEIQAKSIATPTKVPSADFVINPYTGCAFACMYCFASFMGRFVGESNQNWGNYVYVKTNAVELMQHDILRLMKRNPHPRIAISTVTDPYQGVEKKYRLARGILQTFADHDYQGRVGILTKSPMVLDDLPTLEVIPNVEVGITITSSDDKLSRFLEVAAPSASARLRTLKALNEAGIATYVFIGPLMPHMQHKPELLEKLFVEIKATGTSKVKIEYLNLPKHVRRRMDSVIEQESAEIQAVYQTSQTEDYRETLEPIVRGLLDKYNFDLYFDEIIHHVGEQKLVE